MNQIKYIGLDVHLATTVYAVSDGTGRFVAEGIVETKASTILDFLKGQRGTLQVTFEEGTQAAWLYDLIRPHVAKVIVCNPRRINKSDNKADKIDAKRLAALLRSNGLKAVYHGEHSAQDLKELVRSYISIVSDSTRNKNRLKALFQSRGIDCKGAKDFDDHFTGTSFFSSSNQFVMTLICAGVSDSSGVYCFIIRNRSPSGLMSQGLRSAAENRT